MKKIILVSGLLIIFLMSSKTFSQETLIETTKKSAKILFTGRNTKPEILSVVLGNIPGNNSVVPAYSNNIGYNSKGQLVGGNYVLGQVFDRNNNVVYQELIQLADSTEKDAQTLLDRESTVSSSYAKKVCTQQYAALKRLYRKSVEYSYYIQKQVLVYKAKKENCNCPEEEKTAVVGETVGERSGLENEKASFEKTYVFRNTTAIQKKPYIPSSIYVAGKQDYATVKPTTINEKIASTKWEPVVSKLFGLNLKMGKFWSVATDLSPFIVYLAGDLASDGNIDGNWKKEKDRNSSIGFNGGDSATLKFNF